MLEVQWKRGSRHKIKAADAHDELTRIEREFGISTPDRIVEESKPRSAPLHVEFEWDDRIAGHKWRKREAGELVRDLMLVSTETGNETAPARVSVTVEGERGYLDTIHVIGDDELRSQIIEEAKAGLNAWRRRYRHLDEFAEVLKAIGKTID